MYERGVTYIQQHVTLEAGIQETPPSNETPLPETEPWKILYLKYVKGLNLR